MFTQEGKAVVKVQGGNVVHQPVVGGMATGTIRTQRLVVHIRMAGNTFQAGIREHKGFVAFFAFNILVPTGKRKIGAGIVVETGRIEYHFPTGRRMAGGTIYFQCFAVRRLSQQIQGKCQE